MNRTDQINAIKTAKEPWDIVIIGGGASGLGAALDGASRGHKTLLLEKSDFAKGTSSKSTKLIHGGVRYLKQGNIRLVFQALRERGILLKNAPHLVHKMSFIIPVYSWWRLLFYGFGLILYDLLAGKKRIESTVLLSRKKTRTLLPNLNDNHLVGGIAYWDAQFNDTRLAISLARSAVSLGATVINYCSVSSIVKVKGRVCGVIAKDNVSGKEYKIDAKVVLNATGVFSNQIQQMDQPDIKSNIVPSQGTHIVLDQKFMLGNHAVLVPQTFDGRVLFSIPWHDKLLVGTTDYLVDSIEDNPTPMSEEIDYILKTIGEYLKKQPSRKDILSVFSGLRPLVAKKNDKTKDISRNHSIVVSQSGLVSITGGKWTTYRKMAEDAIDIVQSVGEIENRRSKSAEIKLDGFDSSITNENPLRIYGCFSEDILTIDSSTGNRSLGKNFYLSKNQILWGIREEMAIRLEDILARRSRCLFIDAKETIEIAPKVAKIMAEELAYGQEWVQKELREFKQVAEKYIIN